jgi:hypothetical protein
VFNQLFEHDYGQGSKVEDKTEIVTTLLYFAEPELKEFKKLCKVGMKIEFPETYLDKGNITDLLLHLLRKNYGSQKDSSQEETDRPGS